MADSPVRGDDEKSGSPSVDAVVKREPTGSRRSVSPAIQVQSLWKQFDNRVVVRNVSFSLDAGQVLGLVGPNGSGKTTTIRILLGIVSPDRGEVTLEGQPLSGETRERVGYLPEERGLYRGHRVIETLVYLGQLRGLSRRDAARNADKLLTRLGLTSYRSSKISELSRGLTQLVQFAACVVHQPTIVVLDEPFPGLDPVYVRLLKQIVDEMHREGATLILSTHQMNQVEELCDRVVMLNGGVVVLEGNLSEIKRQHRDDSLTIAAQPWPDVIAGVTGVQRQGNHRVMRLLPGTTPNMVLQQLIDSGCVIERFEVESPSMEEIFLSVAEARDE